MSLSYSVSWPFTGICALAGTACPSCAHIWFVTKYRHPVFTAQHPERLEEITRDLCADSGTELAECNGESNHVRLLVSYPPKAVLSRLVSSLKGVSFRRMGRNSRADPALLAGEPAMVRLALRRISRRRPYQHPAPVHRTAEPPRLTPAQVRPPSPPV